MRVNIGSIVRMNSHLQITWQATGNYTHVLFKRILGKVRIDEGPEFEKCGIVISKERSD